MDDDDAVVRVEALSGEECRRLLATQEVGRLAVIVGGYPEVFPVNYALVEDRIVVRVDEGSKPARAAMQHVCLEVDHLGTESRTGWSVLVKGVARLAESHEDVRFIAAAHQIHVWIPGSLRAVVIITPVSVTGRRLTPT